MMKTYPAVLDQQVTLANWRTNPFNHWAFHHVAEIVPSATIHNDPARARTLQHSDQIAMPGCQFQADYVDFAEFSGRCALDAMVVLHKGKIVFEQYDHGMTAQDPHILMSVSKSLLGLLAGILADKGILQMDAPAETFVPELAGTGFANATVRNLLDMRCGVDFVEDYLITEGPMIAYRKSTNWNPLAVGEKPNDLRGFLLSLKGQKADHGGSFDYISPCTDLLGWIIERATGQRYADVMSKYLLKPMCAEAQGQITVDRLGAPRAAGGVCLTARTLAQIGQLLVDGGGDVIPAGWIDDIERNGDPDAWDVGSMAMHFPEISMHYRAKWYVLRNRGPILMCIGVHGQNLIVDRKAGLVMARFCSANTPLDLTSDLSAVSLFEAIRDEVV